MNTSMSVIAPMPPMQLNQEQTCTILKSIAGDLDQKVKKSANIQKINAERELEAKVGKQKDKIFQDFVQHILKVYPKIYPSLAKCNHVTISEFFNTGSPCHFAVVNADDKLLDMLIQLDANIHQKDANAETALQIACKNLKERFKEKSKEAFCNTIKCITHFVQGGCDLLQMDRSGKCPLEYLCELSCIKPERVIEILKTLSREEIQEFSTLLHSAQSAEVAAYLIEQGISVDNFDENGNTPLYNAVDRNIHISYIKFLCERGANPDKKRPQLVRRDPTILKPPLDQCVQNGFTTPQELLNYKHQLVYNRIELIRRNKIKIDLAQYILRNNNYMAIQHLFQKTRANIIERSFDFDDITKEMHQKAIFLLHNTDNPLVINTLIDQGFSVNSLNKECTPLYSRLYRSDWNIAKHLLRKGANPAIGLIYHALASCREIEWFEYFIKKNIPVNQTDAKGDSALMRICNHIIYFGYKANKMSQSEFLLKIILLGFDIFQNNKLGICPLNLIFEFQLLDDNILIELLHMSPEGLKTVKGILHKAKNREIIDFLIDRGVPVDSKDENGNSALFLAVDRLDFDTVLMLISKDADPKLLQPALSNESDGLITSLTLIAKKKEMIRKKLESIQNNLDNSDDPEISKHLIPEAKLKRQSQRAQNIESALLIGEDPLREAKRRGVPFT